MKRYKNVVLKIVICTTISIIFVVLIESFIIQPVKVMQYSMYPTIKENEIILINKWFSITKNIPERGDIVIFKEPSKVYVEKNEYDDSNVIADYSEKNNTNLIKRVVGLPGEHIQITAEGKVYIDGQILEEEYIYYSNPSKYGKYNIEFQFCDILIPEDCLYVLGDNPEASSDSRSFGCIPIEKIDGRVWIRVYPFGAWGKIKFKSYYKYLE